MLVKSLWFAHTVKADVLKSLRAEPHLLLFISVPLHVMVCLCTVLSLLILFVFNGWAFSSSGFSIGTVALMTLALKSFCPGFGAFSVDTRYCLITVVVHQKALVIVGN